MYPTGASGFLFFKDFYTPELLRHWYQWMRKAVEPLKGANLELAQTWGAGLAQKRLMIKPGTC
jgi:hypothetical protein